MIFPCFPPPSIFISIFFVLLCSNQNGFSGFAFYRPDQTKHVSTRKFFEREIFKTTDFRELGFDQPRRCCVLFHKDYVRGKPQGFAPEDVYVCESRYNENAASFHAIKLWKSCIPAAVAKRGELHPPLDLYPAPIALTRSVPSVFADQTSTPGVRKSKSKMDSYAESREETPDEEFEDSTPRP